MRETDKDDAFLAEFFEAAREEAPEADAALMARILAEAETVQAGFGAAVPEPERRSFWQMLGESIGGGAGFGGLVAASAFGLWLGISPAGTVSAYADTLLGDVTVSGTGLNSDYAYLTDLGEVTE